MKAVASDKLTTTTTASTGGDAHNSIEEAATVTCVVNVERAERLESIAWNMAKTWRLDTPERRILRYRVRSALFALAALHRDGYVLGNLFHIEEAWQVETLLTSEAYELKTAAALDIRSQREWDLARACLVKVVRLVKERR